MGVLLETINAAVDRRPELRGHLQAAWKVSWTWRGLVPARNHRPMPAPALLAGVAAAKPLVFTGALDRMANRRLVETGKFWIDVTTPGGLERDAYAGVCGLLRLSAPKTARLAVHSRVQHVVLTDDTLVRWGARVLDALDGEPLWPYGERALLREWRAALTAVGAARLALLPAGLRGGGATSA